MGHGPCERSDTTGLSPDEIAKAPSSIDVSAMSSTCRKLCRIETNMMFRKTFLECVHPNS
jgi:hypothetical protein